LTSPFALKIPPALSKTPGYNIQPRHHPNAFKRSLNISPIGITVANSGTMGIRPASTSTGAVLGSKGKTLIPALTGECAVLMKARPARQQEF